MGDYGYRVVNSLLGSELLPAFLRTKIMRAIGFQIDKEVSIWPGASFRSKKDHDRTGRLHQCRIFL